MFELITNQDICERVLLQAVPAAQKFLWIATADMKDLYIPTGKRFAPFLATLAKLVAMKVSIRILHAGEPSGAFGRDFDRYPILLNSIERMQCPRVHFKCVVVDETFVYTGSANLTGAGMGAKSPRRRNFENGFVTDEKKFIAPVMEQFDDVWMGKYCKECGRKKFCTEYPEIVQTNL